MRLTSDPRRALSRAGAGGVFGVMMLAGAALAAPASVPADADGAQLAKSRMCLGCHQPASKLVGPAFTSVVERYASMGDPVAYLSVSIRQGGRGRWGVVPMPAQPQVSEDEARRLAQWILSLR